MIKIESTDGISSIEVPSIIFKVEIIQIVCGCGQDIIEVKYFDDYELAVSYCKLFNNHLSSSNYNFDDYVMALNPKKVELDI